MMADLAHKFDCVYVDFYQVFDKVSIPLLLKKHQNYGIGLRTMAWITDFLTEC
jgi:hypothetical protein